jgi:hypothetical protein
MNEELIERIECHYKSINVNSTLKNEFKKTLIYFLEFHYNRLYKSDSLFCEIHNFFPSGHNCIACNLNESNRRIENYLLNYKLFYNIEFSISNLIMLLYLQVECIFEYLNLLKLEDTLLHNKFQVFYDVKRWANFLKHPKAFMLVHHPVWIYEPYQKETGLYIDTDIVNNFYSGDSKNKELYKLLSNKENVKVIFPNPLQLIEKFCNSQEQFYDLIKDNKIVRDVFDDKATIKKHFESEEIEKNTN